MNTLIEDLLQFSRTTRRELTKRQLDQQQLVQEVIHELHPETDVSDVLFSIGELPTAYADRALLKQVYMNLIGNALKFARHREPAHITIGSQNNGEEHIYFVKDNGVGFDMRYAYKLFGVFQRLHRPNDYEGTGVGLATVQRIIHRHGGRIWAEAEVDVGATFFFTLGDEDYHHE
jgi:two-component system sensor kinase